MKNLENDKTWLSLFSTTINSINIVFSNCLQTIYTFAIFFAMGDYIDWKNDHIDKLKKNKIANYFKQAPLNNAFIFWNQKTSLCLV